MAEQNQPALIRRPTVEKMTGLSRSSIYDMMRGGTFPQPVRLSLRTVAWRTTDISEWISSRPLRQPAGR
ncbi:MAG: AlpA family phage regulatory protein [Magnetococcales bacterium]|nr:AlpA family phage regulatory protein [Magnetococcales bacterium]